ncbi:MAG: PQQ-dependent sugar dehydrogenase [Phycisphaerales bacterium]|nr:PQQ-dependent sugar dehydrogenase [Phycisphaerales bacterium]
MAAILAGAGVARAQPINWTVAPDFRIERVQSGLRLPVNIAFVPNPGPDPTDPLYYIVELYGSIRVVQRDGVMSTFATGLLDYNPQGPISGSGEQGLTGIAVERDAIDPAITHLYMAMLWDNGAPLGGVNHYPKVERITSTVGGLTMAARTVLLNMQPEAQGQSHQISNVTIGPDGKLYVHMGDGFVSSSALNLDLFRGKVLRMNKDGTPVATGDPAGANPFYNVANGINARDYVFTYGHRNPFGGAWLRSLNKHYIVENGNGLDRMTGLTAGMSYGWAGNDSALNTFSLYVWNPSIAPVNIDFIQSSTFGGSRFPATYFNRGYVTQSGSTYASGPGTGVRKCVSEFPDVVTLGPNGKLSTPPRVIAQYNGTGRSTAAALAAGPDGLYFSDLYEETGANGATAVGASIFRLRYFCPSDFNGSGGTSVQDIFDFLAAYFATLPQADFNGSGGVSVQDIFDFLEAYFNGCA